MYIKCIVVFAHQVDTLFPPTTSPFSEIFLLSRLLAVVNMRVPISVVFQIQFIGESVRSGIPRSYITCYFYFSSYFNNCLPTYLSVCSSVCHLYVYDYVCAHVHMQAQNKCRSQRTNRRSQLCFSTVLVSETEPGSLAW